MLFRDYQVKSNYSNFKVNATATGSQWSSDKTGVMCSRFKVVMTVRATAF